MFFVGRAQDLSQLPDETPFALSPIGKRAKAMHEMTQKHPDRGIPYTPFAVMLDRHAGFHGFQSDTMHPWGVIKPTEDDVSTYHFLSALVPGSLGEHNPESAELKPGPHTPYGMSFDVVTDAISGAALGVYPVCILIGHHDFPPETVAHLGAYLDNGGTVYLTHKHAAQLGTAYKGLRTHGSIRLFAEDKETMTETVQSIFMPLCDEHLPVEVAGGPIEYTINRTPTGWLVGLVNNDGIAKGNLTAVRIDRSCGKHITVRLKDHAMRSANEWCEDRRVDVADGESATVDVPAGEVRVLELTTH